MKDIREKCYISCTAHEVKEYVCDKDICLKRKAYHQGVIESLSPVMDNLEKLDHDEFKRWFARYCVSKIKED